MRPFSNRASLPQRLCAGRRFHQFYFGIWYDPAGTRTHDILIEADTLTYMAISHHDAFPPYHHSIIEILICIWLLHLDYPW